MSDIFTLHGHRALITGGSRGIGAAIAELFVRKGALVGILHNSDFKNSNELRERLAAEGHEISSWHCDVANREEVEKTAAEVYQKLDFIDIVVNCAGIGGDKPFIEISPSDWDLMLSVHLRGTFLITRAFFPTMVERRWGRVINIASQLAYKGAPGLTHYCAAKAGIIGFTRALSYEGAPYNVMVNAIAPGPVDTELLRGLSHDWLKMKETQLPIGRFGKVEEIAPTALLLASDAGAFYCGQTLSPNGGDVML